MMDSGPECGAGTGLGVRGGDTGGRLGQAQIPPVPPLGTWGRGAALPFPAAGQFHALLTVTLSADVIALPLRMCLSLSKAGCSSNTPRSSPRRAPCVDWSLCPERPSPHLHWPAPLGRNIPKGTSLATRVCPCLSILNGITPQSTFPSLPLPSIRTRSLEGNPAWGAPGRIPTAGGHQRPQDLRQPLARSCEFMACQDPGG